MALEVYFKEDLANGLKSTLATLAGVAAQDIDARYLAGALDVIRAQALLYGLPLPRLIKEVQATFSKHDRFLIEGAKRLERIYDVVSRD